MHLSLGSMYRPHVNYVQLTTWVLVICSIQVVDTTLQSQFALFRQRPQYTLTGMNMTSDTCDMAVAGPCETGSAQAGNSHA